MPANDKSPKSKIFSFLYWRYIEVPREFFYRHIYPQDKNIHYFIFNFNWVCAYGDISLSVHNDLCVGETSSLQLIMHYDIGYSVTGKKDYTSSIINVSSADTFIGDNSIVCIYHT